MSLRGFLNIDKPPGLVSFAVVQRIRRATGVRRVGHAGTLDPMATGVLPIAVGAATKLIDELVGTHKRYRGVITLGVETDTYDADGEVVARADASSLSWRDVEAVLEPIRGEVLQRPPSYSAIKRDGEPAYRAARRGTPHELEPRLVTVYSLALVDFTNPRLTIEVECGKGFYVRSLAHDIGATLGVGGHLSAPRRTAVGPSTVEDAVPLDRAVQRLEQGDVETLLHAPDAVLAGWPAVIVGPRSLAALQHGLDLRPEPRALRRAGREGERARCYGPDGRLAALLEGSAIPGAWHPYRVFSG